MHQNIYGTSTLKDNANLNFVAVYITSTGKYYSNLFQDSQKNNSSDDFVGCIHTIEGEGIITFHDRKVVTHKNEIIFIRYKDVCSLTTQNSEWSFYCLWFYLNNLPLEFRQNFPLSPLVNEGETINQIIKLLNNNEYYSLGQANGLGKKLVFEYLASLDIKQNTNPYWETMQQAVFYINQNVQNNLSVKELAENCNLSEKHFRTLFTTHTGLSPKQYIIKTKLERAAFLLSFTSQSVTEISDELSFLSPAYFINRFKYYYKTTPSQYRKTHSITPTDAHDF